MLCFSGLTLGKHRQMLYQPDLIRRVLVACVSEIMHSLGDRFIGLQPKLADENGILVQNDISERRDKL
jgi:hypothetical protein